MNEWGGAGGLWLLPSRKWKALVHFSQVPKLDPYLGIEKEENTTIHVMGRIEENIFFAGKI